MIRQQGSDPSLPPPGAPWSHGADRIRQLITENRLERVVPDSELALRQIEDAQENIAGARVLVQNKLALPAFTSAYDAARLCLTALLEHQGLRARAEGSHRTVEDAATAQLGQALVRQFGALRILRHELEYPTPGGAKATIAQAERAIAFAHQLTETIPQPMERMGVFR